MNMKNLSRISILLVLLTLTSCELIGDIFSAGFYTALFLVVIVVVIITVVVVKVRRK